MIEPLDLCFNGKIEAPDPLDIAAKLNEVIERSNCGESAIDKSDKLQRLLDWVEGHFIVPQDAVTPICVSRVELKAKIKELMDEG